MNKQKIGICQITATLDKEANIEICKNLIIKAKENGARMVFLPESIDFIIDGEKEELVAKAEDLDGNFIKTYRKLAKENLIWISIGGFHRKVMQNNEEIIYNCHVIIDDEGELRHIYNKIHLFEVYLKNQNTVLREADVVSHGKEFPPLVNTPVGEMGTLTCYDLRFPQQSTIYRKLGATVLTYPSCFTKVTGEAHWHSLLKARAIENQCFVIAAAQGGRHSQNRISYGHSLVIDPWGKVLLDMEEKSPHVEVIEINLDYVNEVRKNMPVINSYRDDLYTLVPTIKKPIEQPVYNFGETKLSNSLVFYESQYCIAFFNPTSSVKDHVLVIPKAVRERMKEMTLDETVDLFKTGRLVASKLEKYMNYTSMSYIMNDGNGSIKNVHLNLLPEMKDICNTVINVNLISNEQDSREYNEAVSKATEFRILFYF